MILNKVYRHFCLFSGIAVLSVSCKTDRENQQRLSPPPRPLPQATITYNPHAGLSPARSIQLSVATDSLTVDSVLVTFKESIRHTSRSGNFELALDGMPLGRQSLSVVAYLSNGMVERQSLPLTIFAEAPPIKYTFRKINTFAHDPDAYTQGLLVNNGFLYESTGTKGESTLRKVEINSGKVLRQINLDDKYFGEGLALWKNSLIQLTWTSQTALVYDLETFSQTRTFHYPTEGWGLTVVNNELVMSDGSENLYFMDTESFAKKWRIQVYDHEKPVNLLNELETVGGMIYANVYEKNIIVMIDPQTGAVKGEIDLSGIFNSKGYQRRFDVLNGIAWDKKKNRLFVTGKWWPKLYEIELAELKI